MPTPLLLRSYLLTSVIASPILLRLSMPLLNIIANSSSPLLNPDKNPLVGIPVRKIIYDHFVAGYREEDVKRSVMQMKKTGYNGVILGHAKEYAFDEGETRNEEADVQRWKDGHLRTMKMIGPGDIMSFKLSGAGRSTLKALANEESPPATMWNGLLELCEAARARGLRILIDAEQQDMQPTIDDWTCQLMQKFNKDGKAFMYNTFQAYLKSTPANLAKYLNVAQNEGWTLGVKLVRGAYIATEKRDLIHDTIEDTHLAYDTIVANLLKREYPGVPRSSKPFPDVALMLASHNEASIKSAYAIQKSLIESAQPTIELEFGQLQGMADEISCSLLQLSKDGKGEMAEKLRPKAFKCLTWGSTQDSLQFLSRRVKENGDAVARTGAWVRAFRREIWRRLRGSLGL
ncbi:proline oxidase [Marssonina coronariae]|uniref:Proline dehydrogenase n=1 Tax=Diplocarpon coronariae TaxID=2795749 RepID=A0A218Z2F9_9HELO|nr:proline oxidase [Marssonina coronariae]